MTNILDTVQGIYRALFNARIGFLTRWLGVELWIYRDLDAGADDPYTRVYGLDKGDTGTLIYSGSGEGSLKGIITGDDYVPVDRYTAGSFNGGYLWIASGSDVRVGDVLAIQRRDGRTRRFKLEIPEISGASTEVITKFKLASLGD